MKLEERCLCLLCRVGLVVGVLGAALPQWSAGQSATLAESTRSTLAESTRSTWECLPSETLVAVRVPDGRAFAEALVRDTKLGAVMFSAQRQAAVATALESGESDTWSKFQGQLKEYGLRFDDILQLLAGESGYALVMREDTEGEPILAGIGWLRPGEPYTAPVYEAIANAVDQQEDTEHPVTRVDLILADQPVMQLRVPTVALEYTEPLELSDDCEDLSEADQRAAWDAALDAWADSAVASIRYQTVLVSQLGTRLLFAHNYQAQDAEAAEVAADELASIFGQLLAAHGEDAGGFVARLARDAGVQRVMALDGVAMLEALGDVTALVGLLRATAPSDEVAEQVVRIAGLDGLGPLALRSTIHRSQWQMRIALAAPAPRQGLLRILDQEALGADPPSWVPASAMRYQQWVFDLGKVYAIIKEEVTREFPARSASAFAMAEAQVQGFVSASLPEVLSSLGNRHIALSFGMDSTGSDQDSDDQVIDEEDTDDRDIYGRDIDDRDISTGTERTAIVWQVTDQQLWSRLLRAVAPLAGMAEGLEFGEEQGFSGWRLKRDPYEGGLFLGKGYLVFAFGSGVLESMLSSLNNPPTGADSLRGSKVVSEATSMMDLRPGIGAEITDGNRYMRMLHNWFARRLSHMEKMVERANRSAAKAPKHTGGENDDQNGEDQLALALAKACMPSNSEIDGMMGVTVGRWEVNNDGIFGSSAQELPAP